MELLLGFVIFIQTFPATFSPSDGDTTETSRTFSNTGGVTAESRAFFTASPTCKSPYPYRLSYPASPKSKALSCNTSRIMEFEYEGITPEIKAAEPETCGAAIEVPCMK